MYISIKLPPAFGSFNQIRKENYPFSSLFTEYLAAVSRLGLALGADIDELVGYIEDRVFDGERLPDIPEGNEAVVMRYKTENPDVVRYIGQSRFTNRMAVMCIARMTLRLSAAYGTSLFRLTKLITDLDPALERKKPESKKETRQEPKPKPRAEQTETKPRKQEPKEEETTEMPMPKVRIRQTAETAPAPVQAPVPQTSKSVEAAKAALAELQGLTGAAVTQEQTYKEPEPVHEEPAPEPEDTEEEGQIVQTNPLLSEFY